MRLRILLLLLVSMPALADDFHYSLEQFALIAGYEECARQMGEAMSPRQRDALVDKLLRERGLSYQPRRMANDRRLWAWPEYASQQRLLRYMIPANTADCLERYQGRY